MTERLVAELLRVGGALPAATSVGNARAAWDERWGLVVKLTDEYGHVGCGEMSPLPGYSTETMAEVQAALAAVAVSALVVPAVPTEPEPIGAWLKRVSEAYPLGSAGARFAFETALLDLAGQRVGAPIAELLAAPGTPPVGAVEVSSVLGPEPRRWIHEIAALGPGELPVVKCKIGRDLGLELRCLREVRARWPLLRLRLDANGTLEAAELPRLFEQFSTLGIELVEEPLAGPALFALPRLSVPHAIDESLVLDIERAFASAAGAVVIKPATTGLLEARGLALRAYRAGKGVILTHLFDGPWSLAAVRELAVALPFRPLPCGLAEHAALAAYPRRLVPRSPRGLPLLTPSAHIGLGVAPP